MAKKKEINEEPQKVQIDLLGAMHGQDPKIVPVPEEEIKEKKSNPLFEIIDAIFRNRGYIMNMTEQQANQNVFMVLRRMAINYPIQANVFNNGKVNALDVIKFWSDYLYCGTVPRWAYTSGASKQKKSTKDDITKNDIKEYIEFYGIERKDFDFAMKIYTDETVNDVNGFKEYMKKITSSNGKEESDN